MIVTGPSGTLQRVTYIVSFSQTHHISKKKKKLVQILLVGKLKELHLKIAVIFTYSKNRWIEVRSKLQVRLFYSTN